MAFSCLGCAEYQAPKLSRRSGCTRGLGWESTRAVAREGGCTRGDRCEQNNQLVESRHSRRWRHMLAKASFEFWDLSPRNHAKRRRNGITPVLNTSKPSLRDLWAEASLFPNDFLHRGKFPTVHTRHTGLRKFAVTVHFHGNDGARWRH